MLATWLMLLPFISLDVPPDAPPQHYSVLVFEKNQQCWIEYDKKLFSSGKIQKLFNALPDKSREIWLSASEDTHYRCIGGAIYSAQKAGFLRIGLVTLDDPNTEEPTAQ
jgi:biopolymer transport protein ExbD